MFVVDEDCFNFMESKYFNLRDHGHKHNICSLILGILNLLIHILLFTLCAMEVFHNFITLSWLDHCHLLGHPIYLGKTNINKFELILVSNCCRAHFLKCTCCYLQLFRTYTHFNYCLVDHLKSTKTFNCYSCSNPAESSMYPGSRKKCVILHPDLHPGLQKNPPLLLSEQAGVHHDVPS